MLPTPEFKHFRIRHVHGVVVIEMITKDIQGPDVAKDFISELMTVAQEENDKPIVLNLRRAIHFSSMGYAALFKVVKCAKEHGRQVRFCNMHPDVKVGSDIVGLPLVVEIDDCEESALKALTPA